MLGIVSGSQFTSQTIIVTILVRDGASRCRCWHSTGRNSCIGLYHNPWASSRLPPLDRTREDTVRQIVAGLTGDAEGSGDLASELSKADPVTLENGQESDDDVSQPEDWVPDPVDADPG